jgi:hypothetical protein
VPKTTKKPKPARATPTPKVNKTTTEPPLKTKAKAGATPPPPPTAKPTGAQPRDERLPAPGTVLQKKDRYGKVRCECTVEADGISYQGFRFKSLSAAAMAAAKDLGLGGAQNGFVFWGLVKPPRPARDPQEALGKAWARYHARLQEMISSGVPDDARKQIRVEIQKHAAALAEITKEL